MQNNKVEIAVQYFKGCPNAEEMIARVKAATNDCTALIEYKEILVETPEAAERLKFRGSPTILLNGKDLENMPEPIYGNLACRYYRNGLPSIPQIKDMITTLLDKER